jgi:hypothetical protein
MTRMYSEKEVKHMMRLQAWRELRWVIDEYNNSEPDLLFIVEEHIEEFKKHDLSDLIPSISLKRPRR